MYVVETKHINDIYDFRIQVFKAMGANEAATWLEQDRKKILGNTFVSNELPPASDIPTKYPSKEFNGREY